MARIVKPEVAQDLTDVFPVLEPVSLSPTSVSPELILVQDLLPGTHKFRGFITANDNGAAGVATVFATTHGPPLNVWPVPDGLYYYIPFFHASHNDAATSYIIEVGVGVNGIQHAVNESTVTYGSNARFPNNRPVLLGPGGNIFARIVNPGFAPAAVLTIQYSFIPHRILDPHPKL